MTTLPALLRRNADEFGDLPALSDHGTTLTWSEVRERISVIATGLSRLGVSRGDRVLVMMGNRPEHWIVDQAAVHLGAVPCTVYATTPSSQLVHIGNNSGAKVLVVEGQAQFDRWLPALSEVSGLAHVVSLEPVAAHPRIALWDEAFGGEPDLELFERVWRDIEPSDPATLIYTSGTTGAPKGVLITHDNVAANLNGLNAVREIPQHFHNVCYLPLAHIAERIISLYMPIFKAGHVTFCQDMAQLIPKVIASRPTMFFGVPRVWEKIAAELRAREGATLATLGLDQVKWAFSAAAPLPADVQEYFHGLGLTILEGWGMTEATGVATTTGIDEFRVGSVGGPTPGNEIKLLDDGEILIRGPIIAAGYLQDDGSMIPVVDEEGWLHTGDVGRIEDGHLFITDRKKELIVTSGGKNIAPVAIEALLRRHQIVGQAIAYGDRRPYIVALIVLDAEQAPAWAAARGIEFTDLTDLSTNEQVLEEIDRVVREANEKLSRPEQVKKYRLLPSEWTVETGELTPSLKMKRASVHQNFAAEIAAMYDGGEGREPR